MSLPGRKAQPMQHSIHFAVARRAAALLATATVGIGAARLAAAQTTAQPQQATVFADASETALQAGDVLRLKIWREPDFSGDFAVTEAGIVTLPRLGPLSVTGVPLAQLEAQVIAGYGRYLVNPSIEVIPLRRVSIVGAVRSPGIYQVDPSVTLGQVVNLAGGLAPEGQRGKLELRRNGQRVAVDVNAQPGLAGTALVSGDEVYVPGRSWFARNGTWFVSTLIGVGSTVAFIAARQ